MVEDPNLPAKVGYRSILDRETRRNIPRHHPENWLFLACPLLEPECNGAAYDIHKALGGDRHGLGTSTAQARQDVIGRLNKALDVPHAKDVQGRVMVARGIAEALKAEKAGGAA